MEGRKGVNKNSPEFPQAWLKGENEGRREEEWEGEGQLPPPPQLPGLLGLSADLPAPRSV